MRRNRYLEEQQREAELRNQWIVEDLKHVMRSWNRRWDEDMLLSTDPDYQPDPKKEHVERWTSRILLDHANGPVKEETALYDLVALPLEGIRIEYVPRHFLLPKGPKAVKLADRDPLHVLPPYDAELRVFFDYAQQVLPPDLFGLLLRVRFVVVPGLYDALLGGARRDQYGRTSPLPDSFVEFVRRLTYMSHTIISHGIIDTLGSLRSLDPLDAFHEFLISLELYLSLLPPDVLRRPTGDMYTRIRARRSNLLEGSKRHDH